MSHRILRTLLCSAMSLAILGPVVISSVAMAQPHDRPAPPTIFVTGTATVDASPDQVEIRLSVVTEGEDSRSVTSDNNRKAARILEALRRTGLGEKEATTGRFTIHPIYTIPSRDGADTAPRIKGFRVENTLDVKTKNLAIAGELVQAAVESGANRVDYIQFTLSDERPVRTAAVRQAVTNARAEANAAASAAGVSIKGVRRLNVDGGFGGPIRPMMAADMGRALSAPPLVAGDVSVTANVTIEFDITGAVDRHE